MSRKTLSSIQYENMFKMVNSFLYEYRCQMEIRTLAYEKTIYERDANNRKKRQLIEKKTTETQYLIVTGNGSEYICSVSGGFSEDFKIFVSPKYAWLKDAPDETANTVEEAVQKIENICRKHYLEKYGETCGPYSSFSKRKEFKRLSVGEICDWYNAFRRTDMTIEEIQEAIRIKEELAREKLSYEDVKRALKIDKAIKKLYNI